LHARDQRIDSATPAGALAPVGALHPFGSFAEEVDWALHRTKHDFVVSAADVMRMQN
jgi:hypothetical protein